MSFPHKITSKYIVLAHSNGNITHFEITQQNNQLHLWCTHGGWSGTLHMVDDESVCVKITETEWVHYKYWFCTDEPSYEKFEENSFIKDGELFSKESKRL